MPCRGTRGVRAERGVGTLRRYHPGQYLVVQSLVAGFGRLLVSTCSPSGALVPKRHTCVNFVVSSNTGGAWDNAMKYILAGG